MAKNTSAVYGRVSIWLHWISALLIIGLAIFGTVMTRIGAGATQNQMYQFHTTIGVIVLVLTAARLVWRFVDPWPPAPKELTGGRRQLFKWNHVLLYGVLVVMLASGPAMLLASGLSLPVQNLTPDMINDVLPRTTHDIASKLFMLLFVTHVAGVIMHQRDAGNALGRIGLPWFDRK